METIWFPPMWQLDMFWKKVMYFIENLYRSGIRHSAYKMSNHVAGHYYLERQNKLILRSV